MSYSACSSSGVRSDNGPGDGVGSRNGEDMVPYERQQDVCLYDVSATSENRVSPPVGLIPTLHVAAAKMRPTFSSEKNSAGEVTPAKTRTNPSIAS